MRWCGMEIKVTGYTAPCLCLNPDSTSGRPHNWGQSTQLVSAFLESSMLLNVGNTEVGLANTTLQNPGSL